MVFGLIRGETVYVDGGSQVLGQSVRARAAVNRPGRGRKPQRIGPMGSSFGEFIIP